MGKQDIEEILYNAYMSLAQYHSNKITFSDNDKMDKIYIASINNKLEGLIDAMIQGLDVNTIKTSKLIMKAKGIFNAYCIIKSRNPHLCNEELTNRYNYLIRYVCIYEAQILIEVLDQINIEIVNIEEILNDKNLIKQLGTKSLNGLLQKCISTGEEENIEYYLTPSGSKYHIRACKYCCNKELIAINSKEIEMRKLSPCRCAVSAHMLLDKSCISIFIDESVKSVLYNGEGLRNGKSASYSYIICWGELTSEDEINDYNVITQGVDYCEEMEKTSIVTETAIGKVLFKLICDIGYSGRVIIYTDNRTVAMKNKHCNFDKLFESVGIRYIPRTQNTRADKLGRTCVPMCMPIESYNKLCYKIKLLDTIKAKINQVE